jgi:hypothetical protein
LWENGEGHKRWRCSGCGPRNITSQRRRDICSRMPLGLEFSLDFRSAPIIAQEEFRSGTDSLDSMHLHLPNLPPSAGGYLLIELEMGRRDSKLQGLGKACHGELEQVFCPR